MEEEPVAPDTATRRSKRPRAEVKQADFTRTDRIEDLLEEEREESSDEFQQPRPKAKRNRANEGASTSAAAARKADHTLIEVIKGDGKEIPEVVKRWVEHYERNQKSAMAELLTMLFEACGAKYSILEENIDETDVDDVVVALVNMAKRGEVEDYQSSKRGFKHLKDNLVYFWDNLVSECQNGPLFDQSLFDRCLDYIIALSCTPPRSYRQIASLMGLQLVTSFINVAKILGPQRATTQRQLDAENKKKIDGPRVESLTKRLSMTHEKITTLEEMMRKIFTGLFVHRYRDIDPDIRMSCIESLGVWVLSYPSLFLQDLYLKYLGWTLNDKSSGVRKISVLALQNLYEVDVNVPSLSLFTQRFYKRMLELADDVDISVSVCAIGLVKQLLRHELVPDEELGSFYDLLIDDPPDVRRAIGALVHDHLIAQKFNNSQSLSTGSDSDSPEVHINRMLKILKEFSADPILSSYVIDDIWDYMGAMKDWKCIIRMLLADNPSAELDDADATNLIRLLFASVRKAVGERIVPATDNRNPHHTKAQKEMFENSKRDITVAMMKTYPQLLRKFMPDKDKVAPLVEIIPHMNLELYSLKRQEQNFRAVLKLMREAFFKHGEKDNLRACVKAIKFCSSESQGELQDFAQNQIKDLEDDLVAKLKSAMKDVMNGGDEYSLLVNLKRLYELQLSHKVPLDSLYQDLVHILQSFRNMDDEVVVFLLLNMFLHVSWCLYSILSSETVSEASLSSLLGKRDALLEELDYFLRDSFQLHSDIRSKTQLAYRVCGILADTWCLFKRTKFALTKLEILGYSPDVTIIEKYWRMCEQLLDVSDDPEDEEENREYIEENNADMVMFALAKLVSTDTVAKEHLAPEVISHLEKYSASVAEIVKHLISSLKKKGDISNILLEALKRAYQRYLVAISSGDDEISSKKFQECKNLAARLSGSYVGAARNKYKAEILNIVREGINFAFAEAPKQLSFLEGAMLHFVSKLPASDIFDIMKGVERRTENLKTDEDPSGWRAYYTFLDSLREKYLKNEAAKDGKEGTTVRRRGRPRKQQTLQGKRLFDEQNSSEEEDSISGSDQDLGAEDKQEEDEPLINSLRASSKLRSLRVSKSHTRTVDSDRATEELTTPKTSGASS
ncbi:sister-chromatid cohesion protein 3-like isoform X2 [Salvia miltiorrhiza]|uniref:sister-chromatid cohesion protein 3-like isoform X2 n=1 Tax=Salvia miltiorrhiza TaxID=226208 RepID=UPI0025AC08F1|nr:sister-chromatid cohesion protein 3-like isoform X2 [Salvia miltiorrhiza]XP_057782457.1 sister-chromatid cohesion protein 3-like isoform X2 [Salvia miltiorrhiza]